MSASRASATSSAAEPRPPSIGDRIFASRTGAAAVQALAAGRQGILLGMAAGGLCETPLAEVAGRTKPIDASLFELARVLAR